MILFEFSQDPARRTASSARAQLGEPWCHELPGRKLSASVHSVGCTTVPDSRAHSSAGAQLDAQQHQGPAWGTTMPGSSLAHSSAGVHMCAQQYRWSSWVPHSASCQLGAEHCQRLAGRAMAELNSQQCHGQAACATVPGPSYARNNASAHLCAQQRQGHPRHTSARAQLGAQLCRAQQGWAHNSARSQTAQLDALLTESYY